MHEAVEGFPWIGDGTFTQPSSIHGLKEVYFTGQNRPFALRKCKVPEYEKLLFIQASKAGIAPPYLEKKYQRKKCITYEMIYGHVPKSDNPLDVQALKHCIALCKKQGMFATKTFQPADFIITMKAGRHRAWLINFKNMSLDP